MENRGNPHRNSGKPKRFSSVSEAVRDAYGKGQEDEKLEPIVTAGNDGAPLGRFASDDYVIFYDIRGEREIELTRSLVEEDFDEFLVKRNLRLNFTTMIEYRKGLDVKVAFPPVERISGTLCHMLSENGLRFIKIVESEKSVHVGYFFNGKSEGFLPGEERHIVPSLKALPEERPEMRIGKVVETVERLLKKGNVPIIITNLANVDVVGHTENEGAIIRAIERVDAAVCGLIKAAKREGVTTIVTADHGTVESWLYADSTINTGHTSSPVPFIIIEPDRDVARKVKLNKRGELSDVAPTILEVLGLKKSDLMTGRTLLSGRPYLRNPRMRLLLLILDGWGVSDEKKGNLILKAHTPTMDLLQKRFPSIRLEAAGEAVGMPKGTVGNSEVGHLHLGAGRRIASDRLRIDTAIKNGSFFENPAFLEAMRGAVSKGRALHLLGIVSFYSSHGSLDHLKALLKMARTCKVEEVYIHAILGRRGEKPESGARYVRKTEMLAREQGTGRVVTVIGRHWVLDREENWDRIEKAYGTLVHGDGNCVIIE
jgi:2,3-bisphosphoglycerate-independent phosphoglycerate mutase